MQCIQGQKMALNSWSEKAMMPTWTGHQCMCPHLQHLDEMSCWKQSMQLLAQAHPPPMAQVHPRPMAQVHWLSMAQVYRWLMAQVRRQLIAEVRRWLSSDLKLFTSGIELWNIR